MSAQLKVAKSSHEKARDAAALAAADVGRTHAAVCRLEAQAQATAEIDAKLAALQAKHQDALVQWALDGSRGQPPAPDATIKGLVAEQAKQAPLVVAARGALPEAERRYVEAVNRSTKAHDELVGAALEALLDQIDAHVEAYHAALVEVRGAEVRLQALARMVEHLPSTQMSGPNVRIAGEIYQRIGRGMNTTTDERVRRYAAAEKDAQARADGYWQAAFDSMVKL